MNFMEYINGDFKVSAKDFLVRTGVWQPNKTFTEIVESLNVQMRQVKEECLELLTAYGEDTEEAKVEKLDGVIDVYFTVANFHFMCVEINAMIQHEPRLLPIFEEVASDELVSLLTAIVKPTMELPATVPEASLLKAARLVAENNRLKYTDDIEEAKRWEIDNSDGLETKVVETTVNGITWYCLKDNQGKVRKHKNFVKVKLEDLI